MEAAAYLIGIVVIALTIVIGVIGLKGHYYAALWLGCVAIDLAVIGGACWLHDYWRKADSAATSTPAAPTSIEPPPAHPNPPKNTGIHVPIAQPPAIVANKHVTPEYIEKTIGQTPPLARDSVIKQFIGVPVSWDGTLFDSEKRSDKTVQLLMHWANGPVVQITAFCVTVEISRHPFLLHARPGTVLYVEGIIERITLNLIYLKDTTIAFKADPPTATA